MTVSLDTLLAQYDYSLSPRDIAEVPASPRDSAKLLVYDRATGATTTDTFLHLDQHLPKGALLVFNDTRVVPARLPARTTTGGTVQLLWLRDVKSGVFEALSPKVLAPGATLTLGNLVLTVRAKRDSIYEITYRGGTHALRHAMHESGSTPIPPYLKHTPLSEAKLRREYQTVFARRDGSAAAPTASLHFTRRLLAKLARRGFASAYVTLHVGLGTFAPLTQEDVAHGTLHEEWYEIPPATLAAVRAAKRDRRPIIAVGTTAARALESAFASTTPKRRGETRLFIREGYEWHVVTGLITNFHVPRSSLLMLVAAFIDGAPHSAKASRGKEKLLALYAYAKRAGFRFFSFGDGMLVR